MTGAGMPDAATEGAATEGAVTEGVAMEGVAMEGAAPGHRAALPVSVLTGFLGAGKTTLLRALLAAESSDRTAVLVNEFGEVGIDHLLVDAISADVVLLDSGCVCCQIRGELKEAVLSLLGRRARGEVPPFSRIVVETTGLAEPAPIVSTLAMDPVLSRQVELESVVTVIDAVAAGDTAAHRAEWLEQVAVADTLVLAKTDLVDAPRVDALERTLRALNPLARIVPGHAHRADPGPLFERAAFERGDSPPAAPPEIAHRGGAGHARDVRSLVLEIDAALDWTSFGIWFSALLHAHGKRVLRVKGLLDVGGPGPVLFNSVQHTVHPPEHREAWPPGAPRPCLVFIVDGLSTDAVRRSFLRHVRTVPERRELASG